MLEEWSVKEKLALASSVARNGDQNWLLISRLVRPFANPGRTNDWFSQMNCAQQYSELLNYDNTKESNETTNTNDIIRKLTIDRIAELKTIVAEQAKKYRALREEIEDIKAGKYEGKMKEKWDELQRIKKEEASKLMESTNTLFNRHSKPSNKESGDDENTEAALAAANIALTETVEVNLPETEIEIEVNAAPKTPPKISPLKISTLNLNISPRQTSAISPTPSIKSPPKTPHERQTPTKTPEENKPVTILPGGNIITVSEEAKEVLSPCEVVMPVKLSVANVGGVLTPLKVSPIKISFDRITPEKVVVETEKKTIEDEAEVDEMVSNDKIASSEDDIKPEIQSELNKNQLDEPRKGVIQEDSFFEDDINDDLNNKDENFGLSEEIQENVDSCNENVLEDVISKSDLSDNDTNKSESFEYQTSNVNLNDKADNKYFEYESANLNVKLSFNESLPGSPASVSNSDTEDERSHKIWKKSIMLVWRAMANHKFANVFLHPVTEDIAPGYHSVVFRPMDLSTIRKNIDVGIIRTTAEFQRDVMLMFTNAIMYNSAGHNVHSMARSMFQDAMAQIEQFVSTQMMVRTEPKLLRGLRRSDVSASSERFDEDIKKRKIEPVMLIKKKKY